MHVKQQHKCTFSCTSATYNNFLMVLSQSLALMYLTLLGKGTMTWKKSGAIYDGDWKDDHRCGFGTYSFPEGAGFRKVYSGGWKNDKRHVCIHDIQLQWNLDLIKLEGNR